MFLISLSRIPFHADEILKVLLKLVSDLCPAMEEVPEKQGWENSA